MPCDVNILSGKSYDCGRRGIPNNVSLDLGQGLFHTGQNLVAKIDYSIFIGWMAEPTHEQQPMAIGPACHLIRKLMDVRDNFDLEVRILLEEAPAIFFGNGKDYVGCLIGL